MKKTYNKEVNAGLNRIRSAEPGLIRESDLQHLPPVVRKYLNNAGVVGREKLFNFKVRLDGKIRSRPEDSWMSLKSEQYNFFDQPTRIFYIKAFKMGIPATGIHVYKEEKAIMLIKLAGLFTISDAKGPEMDQAETVTVLNDMCLLAPATLIDKNILWEIIDPLTVKALFTNGKLSVSATLFFNDNGDLVNFISNDRFETTDGKTYKNYPWSTPIKEYKVINGIRVGSSASAIYHRPDSDFCYAEFVLKEIEYNCRVLK